MAESQTYANHRRFEPLQHFFITPVLMITWISAVVLAVKHPNIHNLWMALVAFTVFLLAMQVRVYALKVQDRVIRLEETLRMQKVLPAELQVRIPELSVKQFVGLRFAADPELSQRVREALDEQLSGEQIKKRIQTWRPDTFRI